MVPDRPHVVWRAYSFRSRGFFRASRAGDAMRARAHPRVRGRAAMRARFPRHACIRRPTRASRARRLRPRAPRPPGSLAARTRRAKRDLPVGCHRAESASRDSASRWFRSRRFFHVSFRDASFFLAALRRTRLTLSPLRVGGNLRVAQIRVTGNNRTKPGVIGLRGVVKKAVGLGGWHWLRLENGAECRLQRNALAVVAPPTGLEMDSESDDDDLVPPSAGYGRGAGGGRAIPMNDEKVVPRSPGRGDDDAFVGRPRRASRPPRRVAPEERPRRRDGGASRGAHEPSVRFDKLRTETLEKISAKHYKIPARDSATLNDSATRTDKTTSGARRERSSSDDEKSSRPEKRALVETIAARFTSETVDETKVLIAFVKALAGGELPSPEPSGRDA